MYDLIVYKVINFKIPRGSKMINKRYFQRVHSIYGIDKKELTKKHMELKEKYLEWCYIVADVKHGEVDWYITNLNKKSEKAYKEYILNGGHVYSDIII